MKKYSTYKSKLNNQWFDSVPSNWDIIALKHISIYVKTGSTPQTKEVKYYENGEIDWYTPEDINSLILKDSKKKISKLAITDGEVKIFQKDSLLIVGIGATIGKIGLLTKNATSNQQINAILFNKKATPKFGLYYFYSIAKLINDFSSTSTMGIFNQTKTKAIYIPIPSISEQNSIVGFLDYKTAQIDNFIANRQKQIELLKEQKAGIINKAVTKGINPNAKMKASGIEWVGDIPTHWFVGKVRRVLSVLTDFTANGSFADLAKNVNYLDTPDYSRLIRLTDLREDLRNDGIYVNKHAHEFLSKSELFGGEILMANVGAYAGFVCLVPEIDFTATLGPNMILLKFDRKQISNQYAYTLLSSNCYYKLLMNKALSSAQPKLNKEDVKSIDLIFPPTIEEQNIIIEYIKQETSTIDNLISKYQKQIDLMQEYRTSLISQAVTGKIDVRDWKPKK